jgi:hypothetical protein
MTEKQQSEKKPIWESIDEKEVEEGKRRYIEDIGAAKSRLEEYKCRGDDPAIKHQVPSMQAHFATLYVMQSHHIEMLEAVYDFLEGFVELNNQLAVVLQLLDKQVQEISEKTGIDLSQIKSEMAQVKETVNAPIYKYLKEQKEAEEKIRKSGETTFDQLTRSH